MTKEEREAFDAWLAQASPADRTEMLAWIDGDPEKELLVAEHALDAEEDTTRERVGSEWVQHLDAGDFDAIVAAMRGRQAKDPALAERFAEIIDALPEKQRAVMNALYFEQLTEREAAARLGYASMSSVQWHEKQALVAVRRAMLQASQSSDDYVDDDRADFLRLKASILNGAATLRKSFDGEIRVCAAPKAGQSGADLEHQMDLLAQVEAQMAKRVDELAREAS